jgi:hypothetical protein
MSNHPYTRHLVVQDVPRGSPARYELSREGNSVDVIGAVQMNTPPLQYPMLTSLTEPVSGADIAQDVCYIGQRQLTSNTTTPRAV